MAQPVTVILVPFHAGVRDQRVGRGPRRLVQEGLLDRLGALGRLVSVAEIEPVDAFEGEIGRTFEIKRRVALRVAQAVGAGSFPLVLAGNCNTSVGVHAGLADSGLGVAWFDAHTDFDTPDERTSGYFDGMGVGTLTGRCWQAFAATIPGHRALNPRRLVYCGIRDFEPGQRERVEAHGIRAVYGAPGGEGGGIDFASELAAAMADQPSRVLVHLDVDCLDTRVGCANEYASPGGLSGAQLRDCMVELVSRRRAAAMTVASFNPEMDGSAAIAAAAMDAVIEVIRRAD